MVGKLGMRQSLSQPFAKLQEAMHVWMPRPARPCLTVEGQIASEGRYPGIDSRCARAEAPAAGDMLFAINSSPGSVLPAPPSPPLSSSAPRLTGVNIHIYEMVNTFKITPAGSRWEASATQTSQLGYWLRQARPGRRDTGIT